MTRAFLLLGLVALAWVTGRFAGFINLSSLQSFYSARLTRAFLGASNRARFVSAGNTALKSAAEPVAGDDLSLDDFLHGGNPVSLAPFHIINVTVNKTVDPAEQLVQRDRKGQPLAVSPLGFAIDGVLHDFKAQDRKQKAVQSEIQRNLSVGRWIGTSGAALSTGIGRQTSLGLSLLLGSANVRLGTWWECGINSPDIKESLWARSFPTQTYLAYEFTARFHGLQRKWQYLSDGGHFENTGVYELLRDERDVRLVLAVDAGADPDYQFNDLANLIRLARIDFGVEISIEDIDPASPLVEVFGKPSDFRKMPEVAGQPVPPRGSKCAVLLRVTKPALRDRWIVLIKPTVLASSPIDVLEYADAHEAFPQETTADQFFDEAQWESYRKLGLLNMEAVMTDEIRKALGVMTGTSFG